MKLLSLVVPCYNEEDTITTYYDTIRKLEHQLEDLEIEFIFVDDGSTDGTLRKIMELKEQDNRVHYLSFSRNFGKEAALLAGLKKARGDYVVTMDVDLQDPPELLPEMYRAIVEEEYDCVATYRVDRKGEAKLRSFFAKLFYKLMNKLSKTEIKDGARDYRFMTKQMVTAILSLQESTRFTKGIYSWVGFRTKWIPFENHKRSSGMTKWSLGKLFIYSLDGMIAFTTSPLAVASILGIVFCIISFVMMCFIFVRSLIWNDPVSGWPSLVCIIIFFSGIQLLCLGILGLYLSKTYIETKNRPIYIVKKED